MDRQAVYYIIFAFVIIGYLLFYVGGRRYLYDGFQSAQTAPPTPVAAGQTTVAPGETKPVDLPPVEVPYAKQPINELDDYEYNLVFQNESDRALTKGLRDKLMSQYPMDWSAYPPSSSQFQAGLRESFENATPSVPDDAKPYQNITGNLMQPPDKSEIEKEERKILQTYKPKFPPGPTSYDVRDADALIKQLYDAKGLIPEVRHKEGTNIYEVIGVRKKDEKVEFEEEAAATSGPNPAAGESTTQGPMAAVDATQPQPTDSFFQEGVPATSGSRMNRWNYTAWTPGLERMFAPTEERQNWY